MEVLRESWCFCNGGGKSERMKASIYSGKGPAMARIGSAGTGFLIHRNLLLTTHSNLPSVAAAEAAEIRLHNGASASLFPHRFFITSSVLDLSIVGLDANDGEASGLLQTQHLKTCSKPNLDLGSSVYLLGYTENVELTVGEGKLVIATDNLIKLSAAGVACNPGSAGFDVHGNLAFIVCDPMKLATSPNTRSSSTSSSSSSWKKDLPMQFGIPIPIICDWLKQHWEGNLDDISKPKLPIIRLMSTGQKSEYSCASFTMRQVFKTTEPENGGSPSSSDKMSKSTEKVGPSCSVITKNREDESSSGNLPGSHAPGIPRPEISGSPRLTTSPSRKKESTQIHLLDINFPPRAAKLMTSPLYVNKMQPRSDEKYPKEPAKRQAMLEDQSSNRGQPGVIQDAEIVSTRSNDGGQSEAQSSSSPVHVSEMKPEYSSEGETTMYSAETAESHNYRSPRQGRFQPVGRSHSCVNYNRWGPVQKGPVARRTLFEKQRSFMQPRKVYSQGATSGRGNDYYSPTVSSIMKKRNMMEQPNPPRQSAIYTSPKWMF